MATIGNEPTIRQALEAQARKNPDRVYLRFEDQIVTVGELDRRVNRLANGLAALGFSPGDRVAIMLPNHPDHFYTFLACTKLGLVQVPVNTNLRGASLDFLVAHADPHGLIADIRYADALLPALAGTKCKAAIWRGGMVEVPGARLHDFDAVIAAGHDGPPPGAPHHDDILSLSYTSGTTGQPKGVMVTDKMFRTAAHGAAVLADMKPRDVLFLWEPLFHIGGSEVIVAAVQYDVTIALVERFSASRFWNQVCSTGSSHIHHIGGILSILLKQLPAPGDADNPVRVAWGAGASAAVRRAFAERFKVQVHESYGMTECSSITTVNLGDHEGYVGKPMPYFEVRILDEEGRVLGPGQMGEIVVREREPGLIMKGYFRNPEATARALKDGWMHTGDLGAYDADGVFQYLGRKKDSIRRRGENVSAWEVERILQLHPAVEECAVVGVDADLGEQDIKAFVKPIPGSAADPLDLVKWCEARLAYFQVPRYVAFVDGFAKTPTERIQKEKLPRSVADSWDLEKSGYVLARR
jgi:crotonobetaine/carnitine-CoA ligase